MHLVNVGDCRGRVFAMHVSYPEYEDRCTGRWSAICMARVYVVTAWPVVFILDIRCYLDSRVDFLRNISFALLGLIEPWRVST